MSTNRFATTIDCRTCLVHHVDKYLCIIYRKAMDCLVPVLAREDNFNQHREFTRKKFTCD